MGRKEIVMVDIKHPMNKTCECGHTFQYKAEDVKGSHRVLCGDSTQPEAVLRLMGQAKADMIFTDPPYGVKMSRSLVSGKDNSIQNDSIDGLDILLSESFTNASIVSKQNVPLYCWIGFRAYSIAENVIGKIWKINNCIVWKKPSIGLGGRGFRLQHELCIFSGNIEDKSQSDVWEFSRDKSGLHPTMKPVDLIVKALSLSSKEDDMVLDLFLGSGSTLIACEKTGRICYGVEIDPKFVDVIVQRYVDYTNNTKVIKNGKEEIWQKSENLMAK
jgi:DNA modification methylase